MYCAGIYTGNFHIVDVSDKSNPITLASHFTGIDGISTHDVAVTEDENYLFTDSLRDFPALNLGTFFAGI